MSPSPESNPPSGSGGETIDHTRPMTGLFEELDYRETEIGALSLRRKRLPMLDDLVVYEVKIDEGFLMSSLFTAVERAVASLGLAGLEAGPLDVVVGGLGLGHTAAEALAHPDVRSLIVVEMIEPVIDWHRRGLVPLGKQLTGDPRFRMVRGDFFAMARDPAAGFDPDQPGRRFHAVLLDIDHTPDLLLRECHGGFYQPDGLRRLADHLHPGGMFAMWSDGGTNDRFLQSLQTVFPGAEARRVAFHNPLQDRESASTVYLARNGK